MSKHCSEDQRSSLESLSQDARDKVPVLLLNGADIEKTVCANDTNVTEPEIEAEEMSSLGAEALTLDCEHPSMDSFCDCRGSPGRRRKVAGDLPQRSLPASLEVEYRSSRILCDRVGIETHIVGADCPVQ